ncbi:MAG TPA: hypothetical protein VI776_06860, partial [Anaerolineales bacterium]|nr:hypothetical protein [Anaerolineales bacterium]
LEEHLGAEKEQIILVGHSMGATMVMDAARKDAFLLSIPIGLGDWRVVLDSPKGVRDHVNKIKQYTGVSVDPEMLRQSKAQYVPEVVFGSCPLTPVRLIFTRYDDGPKTLFPYFNEAQEKCTSMVGWRILPLGDHMYGTELNRFPKLIRDLYSRISLTLLKWQLLDLIERAEP